MADTQKKLDDYRDEARRQLEAAGVGSVDDGRLGDYVKRLSSVIENRDALYVAASDESERETVRRNFVVKRLGVDDRARGEQAIAAAADRMSGSHNKNRAAFYYLVEDALG